MSFSDECKECNECPFTMNVMACMFIFKPSLLKKQVYVMKIWALAHFYRHKNLLTKDFLTLGREERGLQSLKHCNFHKHTERVI